MARKRNRINVKLQCTQCNRFTHHTHKNKALKGRLELMKFCKFCVSPNANKDGSKLTKGAHVLHKQTK